MDVVAARILLHLLLAFVGLVPNPFEHVARIGRHIIVELDIKGIGLDALVVETLVQVVPRLSEIFERGVKMTMVPNEVLVRADVPIHEVDEIGRKLLETRYQIAGKPLHRIDVFGFDGDREGVEAAYAIPDAIEIDDTWLVLGKQRFEVAIEAELGDQRQ